MAIRFLNVVGYILGSAGGVYYSAHLLDADTPDHAFAIIRI
jgi:hypothetical protein